MDRPGGVPGGIVAELKNLHSQRIYFISTAPVLDSDYWTTTVYPTIVKKGFMGLSSKIEPDARHAVVTLIRNNQQDAHRLHAEVRHVVGDLPEGEWFASWPSPRPPGGYSPGARVRLRAMGVDPD